MKIKQINVGSFGFDRLCDSLEENITEENLRENGGTLNYSGLTYDSHILFVAYENGKPIGYNSIVIEGDGSYYIWQIAVKKEYQSKGIGKALLTKAIELAHETNSYVSAHIMDYNTSSQRLFLSLGFTKVSQSEEGNGFYIYDQQQRINKR